LDESLAGRARCQTRRVRRDRGPTSPTRRDDGNRCVPSQDRDGTARATSEYTETVVGSWFPVVCFTSLPMEPHTSTVGRRCNTYVHDIGVKSCEEPIRTDIRCLHVVRLLRRRPHAVRRGGRSPRDSVVDGSGCCRPHLSSGDRTRPTPPEINGMGTVLVIFGTNQKMRVKIGRVRILSEVLFHTGYYVGS
jgi:hypothetical protein